MQSFIYNLIKIKEIGSKNKVGTNKKIDINNIPQVINTCNAVFTFSKI